MTWRVARFSPTPATGWKGRPFLPNSNYEGAHFSRGLREVGCRLSVTNTTERLFKP
jgi:hypothetical protein